MAADECPLLRMPSNKRPQGPVVVAVVKILQRKFSSDTQLSGLMATTIGLLKHGLKLVTSCAYQQKCLNHTYPLQSTSVDARHLTVTTGKIIDPKICTKSQ